MQTLQYFHCGYISNWVSPKSRSFGAFATPTPRVIIPSADHYLARLTVSIDLMLEIDYSTRDKILPLEREKAFKFLSNALGIKMKEAQ